MNRWREKTFGDVADAARLYRPFIGAVLALTLVAVTLPGPLGLMVRDEFPRTKVIAPLLRTPVCINTVTKELYVGQ